MNGFFFPPEHLIMWPDFIRRSFPARRTACPGSAAVLLLLSPAAPAWGQSFFGVQYNRDDAPAQLVTVSGSSVTAVGDTGFQELNALTLGPDGMLYSVGGDPVNVGGPPTDRLLRINPSTGAATQIGTLTFAGEDVSVRGAAFVGDDLYFMNNDGTSLDADHLWRHSLTTGVSTLVDDFDDALQGVQSLVADPAGGLLAFDGFSGAAGRGLVRLATDGSGFTDLVPALVLGGDPFVQGLSFHDGVLYGATQRDGLFTLDLATEARTPFFTPDAGQLTDLRGLAVPEPAGVALALLGAGALLRRRPRG